MQIFNAPSYPSPSSNHHPNPNFMFGFREALLSLKIFKLLRDIQTSLAIPLPEVNYKVL